MWTKLRSLASLLVPALVGACLLRFDLWNGRLLVAGAPAEPAVAWAAASLIAIWLLMMTALAVRVWQTRAYPYRTAWDVLDVLTSAGRATMWTGLAAILLALGTGWASLSVLGLLGLGVTYLAVTWTAVVAMGERPWRRAVIKRVIAPQVCTEGEPAREELKLSGISIPAGMRLFASGRPSRRGAITRYVFGGEASGAEVAVETSLGCVARGEHRAEPISMWFADALGLARTPAIARCEGYDFTVLPKPLPVENVRELLGNGGDAPTSVQTERMPTEGTFRIREYVPGDDARRIHWVRSLQANELVVRLPDEIPPADPVVRLVLDTHLFAAQPLSCMAPDQLMDAMVRVWLGVGKALAATGTRVTLAAPVDLGTGRGVELVERPLLPRPSRDALRLGARAAWQGALAVEAYVQPKGARHVVVSCRPRPISAAPDLVWIFMAEGTWTTAEPWLPVTDAVKLPFPIGSAENQAEHRKRERTRVEHMWRDRMIFHQQVWWRAPSGAYVANPSPQGRVALQVLP